MTIYKTTSGIYKFYDELPFAEQESMSCFALDINGSHYDNHEFIMDMFFLPQHKEASPDEDWWREYLKMQKELQKEGLRTEQPVQRENGHVKESWWAKFFQ